MKKDRRWMKSALAASAELSVSLPWARGARRKPEALKPALPKQRPAVAAS